MQPNTQTIEQNASFIEYAPKTEERLSVCKDCRHRSVSECQQPAYLPGRLRKTIEPSKMHRIDPHEEQCMTEISNGRYAAYECAYYREIRRNSQMAEAYRLLSTQHERSIDDLSALASKYWSLQKDLETLQTNTLAQDAAIQEYERQLASQCLLINRKNETKSSTESLMARIAELETEKSDMRKALSNASDIIITLNNKQEGRKAPDVQLGF